jgi:hypothetical protein
MNPLLLRRLFQAECQNLLDALSARQHLSPHEPVTRALDAVGEQLGVCPQAVGQAVAWLRVDGSQSVGRLRRTELMQLARSIHRFWRQRTPAEPPADPPQPTERRP